MSRGTTRVSLTIPNVLSEYINVLLRTGMFGTTRAEVLRELLRMQLRTLAPEGWLLDYPSGPAHKGPQWK